MGEYDDILENTDLILYDVKHYDTEKYREITAQPIERTQKFLDSAQRMNVPLWIRHVVVPGLTDSEEHFRALEEYLKTLKNVKRIELLPYHTLGVEKYKAMGIKYRLEGVRPMKPEEVKIWNDRLNKNCLS